MSPQKNIEYFISLASEDEAERDRRWYFNARDNIIEAAQETQTDTHIFAAMTAVMSNTMRWERNIDSVKKIILNQSIDGIPTYKWARYKAWAIWITNDIGLVTGPKVIPFFYTLLNPYHDEPVIDLWMMRAAGYKVKSNNTARITEMRQVSAAVRSAAKKCSWTVAGTQALVWMQVRNYWHTNVGKGNPFIHPITKEQVA